jgi:hypothetical protein
MFPIIEAIEPDKTQSQVSSSKQNLIGELPSSLVSFVNIFRHGNSLRKT